MELIQTILSWLIGLYVGLQLWGGQTCWPQELNDSPIWIPFPMPWPLLPHALAPPCSPFPWHSHLPKSILSKSFPCPRRFSAPVSKTPGVQLQNPSSHLPSSETSHPHLDLHTPTGHDSCAASPAWMCVDKHGRPLESGPATSPYQSVSVICRVLQQWVAEIPVKS